MKFDDDFIKSIPTVSIQQFLILYNALPQQLTRDDNLLYLHLCEAFERHDLAVIINFIAQLNHPVQSVQQTTLLTIFAELSAVNWLPDSIKQQAQQVFARLQSLPQFAALTDHGKIILFNYLKGRELDHPQTITFCRQYNNERILSLIETCDAPEFLARLTTLFFLTREQKNALALNPLFRKQVIDREIMLHRTRDDLIQFYYARQTQAYFLRHIGIAFFKAHQEFALGHLYRLYLAEGHFHRADQLCYSQKYLTKRALSRFGEVIQRKQVNGAQASPNIMQAPLQMTQIDLLSYLPLETVLLLRTVSKAHKNSLQQKRITLKPYVSLFQLGQLYSTKLRQFRKINDEHLYYLTHHFMIKMIMGAFITEVILNHLPSPNWFTNRFLLYSFFFFLFSDLHQQKYPFDIQDPVGLSLRKKQAQQMIPFVNSMLTVIEMYKPSQIEPWYEFEMIRFEKELTATLAGLNRFVPGQPTTAVSSDEFKLVFTQHPESHLYITYSNRFFKQDYVGPYFRMLKRHAAREHTTDDLKGLDLEVSKVLP